MHLASLVHRAFLSVALGDASDCMVCLGFLCLAPVVSSRAAIDAAADGRRVRLPGLDNFKWRVDVAISTSSLKRAMKPSVLMQMTLTDGRIHTFEVRGAEHWRICVRMRAKGRGLGCGGVIASRQRVRERERVPTKQIGGGHPPVLYPVF